MAHCGYEPTAADMTISHPLKALQDRAVRRQDRWPDGPEISLANQRPAQYTFAKQVEKTLTQLSAKRHRRRPRRPQRWAAKAAAERQTST